MTGGTDAAVDDGANGSGGGATGRGRKVMVRQSMANSRTSATWSR
jgi:hypothetical protein